MTLTELVIAALATWQAVEIWHHSDLCAGRRAIWEDRIGFRADVLRCPWCLSVWVSLFVSLMLYTAPTTAQLEKPFSEKSLFLIFCEFIHLIWLAVIYGLAVSRLANLGNDLTKRWRLTPGPKKHI